MQSISLLEIPSDALALLQDLSFDLRWNCMSTLLKQAVEGIRISRSFHNLKIIFIILQTSKVCTSEKRGV
jgi:hypothetical protein